MRTKHTATTTLTFWLHEGAEAEREVQVRFTYLPGRRATGPSYASGGEPEEPAEVEIDAIVLAEDKLTELPWWMVAAFQADEGVYHWLCHEAAEDRAADADAWAEMTADEARGN